MMFDSRDVIIGSEWKQQKQKRNGFIRRNPRNRAKHETKHAVSLERVFCSIRTSTQKKKEDEKKRKGERTLTVSTGIRKIRHPAAAPEAATVLTATGRSFVAATLSSSVRTPVLAAVSPNRLMGPWMRAGRTPR